MFNHKSDNTEENLTSSPMNPSRKEKEPKTIINIDDFPVHTMNSELKALTADNDKPEFIVRKSASPMLANDMRPIENAPKNSQFQASIEKNEGGESHSNFGKILIIVTTLLILAIIIAGGYYFWMTRMHSTQDSPIVTMPIPEDTTADPIAPQQASSEFSESQANYLSIDISTMNATDIKDALKKYTDQVSQLKASGPIEFIVTDKMNNPVSFQDFSQKIGILLPQSILSQLGQAFSLYIYTDNSYPRFGMAVLTKNNELLKIAMSQEEENLSQNLQAIFINTTYDLDNATPFSSSVYNGNQIRYTNILPAGNLSIDYTILNGQLIIGTSKFTERAIIDYVLKTPSQTAR